MPIVKLNHLIIKKYNIYANFQTQFILFFRVYYYINIKLKNKI